jgi:hypothetical protein
MSSIAPIDQEIAVIEAGLSLSLFLSRRVDIVETDRDGLTQTCRQATQLPSAHGTNVCTPSAQISP